MDINRATLEQFYYSVSAAFMDGLGTAESQYEKITMVVSSSNKENVYPWLGTLPSMEKWAGDRIIRNLKAHKYSIENEKFEMLARLRSESMLIVEVVPEAKPESKKAKEPASVSGVSDEPEQS